MRPAIVLKTPSQIGDYEKIKLAPGTSKFHKHGLKEKVLKVDSPPEKLEKTTWFLIYYPWYAYQKDLIKHYTEITGKYKDLLLKMIGDIN